MHLTIEEQYRKMIRDALEDDPAALEYLVFGDDALHAHLQANEAASLNAVARMLTAVSEGIVLIAKEIDALKAAIEARDDKSDPVEAEHTRRS